MSPSLTSSSCTFRLQKSFQLLFSRPLFFISFGLWFSASSRFCLFFKSNLSFQVQSLPVQFFLTFTIVLLINSMSSSFLISFFVTLNDAVYITSNKMYRLFLIFCVGNHGWLPYSNVGQR